VFIFSFITIDDYCLIVDTSYNAYMLHLFSNAAGIPARSVRSVAMQAPNGTCVAVHWRATESAGPQISAKSRYACEWRATRRTTSR